MTTTLGVFIVLVFGVGYCIYDFCYRFDQSLKDMVSLNTRGTKCMLDLAKECPNLEVRHFSFFWMPFKH